MVALNLKNRLKHGRVIESFLWRIERFGVTIIPYVWYEENLEFVDTSTIKKVDPSFAFSFFDKTDMEVISSSSAWNYRTNQLLSWLNENKKCYGIKRNGEIVAFTWFDLEECNCNYRRFKLKSDEAYLFDMFTMKPFRGYGIAPYLRYKGYEAMKELGRDRCYSYSDYFNTPARKFKAKLNAKPLELCIFIELIKKYRKTILVNRF